MDNNPAIIPDYYFAQILHNGAWINISVGGHKTLDNAIFATRMAIGAQWRRVVKSGMVWNEEGEYKPQDNGCLPGKHCLGKSRDCLANGCLRELQEINSAVGHVEKVR